MGGGSSSDDPTQRGADSAARGNSDNGCGFKFHVPLCVTGSMATIKVTAARELAARAADPAAIHAHAMLQGRVLDDSLADNLLADNSLADNSLLDNSLGKKSMKNQ